MPDPPSRSPLVGWAVAVLGWSILPAPLSTTRLLGAVMLIILPAALWWWAPQSLRSGIAASALFLLMAGVLGGAASGATIGTAAGGITAWAGVAIVVAAPTPTARRIGTAGGAIGVMLVLASEVVSTGPRVLGVLVALTVGIAVGRRMRRGAPRPSVPEAPVDVVWAAIGVLLCVGVVRTLWDADAQVHELVTNLRRALSLVLPVGPDLIVTAIGGSGGTALRAALPTLLPLAGAAIALIAAGRTPCVPLPIVLLERPQAAERSRSAAIAVLAGGLLGTMLLDLIGINWGGLFVESTGGRLLWPDRRVETVLWGLAAAWAGRGPRLLRNLPALLVSVAVGLVLLTVLIAEWRVDGVALRPDLLAPPVAAVGMLRLAGGRVRPVALAATTLGTIVLVAGLALSITGVGPALTGPRSVIPGASPLLAEGARIRGLLPASTMLGSVAAATMLAAALLLVRRTTRPRERMAVRTLAWLGIASGIASVLLGEAKTAWVALLAAVVAAIAAPHAAARIGGGADGGAGLRRSGAVGGLSGILVAAVPFVTPWLLGPEVLRVSLWLRLIRGLNGQEWLVGLGAQPLRWDRTFHQTAGLPWPALHAHNEAMELLLIAGITGPVLLAAVVASLAVLALRGARVAQGWPAAVATVLVLGGITTPNLTYFSDQYTLVLLLALVIGVVGEDRIPELVPLRDDPQALPQWLAAHWRAGDAAFVTNEVTAIAEGDDVLRHSLRPGTALVVPTSGSTGRPRAVILRHDALTASTVASLGALGCKPGERWALALPLRHVAGLQVLARARALGTAVHVVDDPGDPRAIAAASVHAEHIALVPTQLVRCLDAEPDVISALARFRTVLVGGGPLSPSRADEAREAGIALTLTYGMTEMCGGCVYDGRPLAGVEVDVDARPGESGRIRLRGPMRATGYLDPSPEETARFTADGWFVTDDIGRVTHDSDGPLLEVLGRADAVINTGGVKVDPVAVATLLRAHPAVADAVVVGVPDAEWGERVVAVVVPASADAPLTLDTLRDAVTSALPAAHAPREVRIVDTIARDGMGKVSAAERERLRSAR